LWDVAGKSLISTIEGRAGINAVAYSPNGQFIAFGSQDGTVTLLDAASGEPLATLRGHTAAVTGLAFSPDSILIATAGDDGAVKCGARRLTSRSSSCAGTSDPSAASCSARMGQFWSLPPATGQ
jgi:WD40 repeat protein